MRNDKNNDQEKPHDQSNAFGNRHVNRIIVDDGIIKQEMHIPPDFFPLSPVFWICTILI